MDIPMRLSDEQESKRELSFEHELVPTGKSFSALLLIGFGLTLVSLFVPYDSATGNHSLASYPTQLLYNIPLLLVLGAALALSWADVTRRAAIVLALISAAWLLAGDTSDVLGTIVHQASLGLGAQLSLGGDAVMLVAGVLGWIETPLRVRVQRDALVWAGLSCAVALVWFVGEMMDWTRTHLHLAAATWTFPTSHTNDLVTSCCVAFRHQTMPNNVREALTDGLIVVAATAVAFLIPRRTAAIALMGVGVIYLSNSLSWIYPIFQGNVDPVSVSDTTAAVVRRGQETATVSALPAGWIALAAASCLFLLGVFRLLSTFASSHDSQTTAGRDADL